MENHRELLEEMHWILLGQKITLSDDVRSQKKTASTSDMKYSVMDVVSYSMDNTIIFDDEMENGPFALIGDRSVWYHLTLKADRLKQGKPYKELPTTIVTFICTRDDKNFSRGITRFMMRSSDDMQLIESKRKQQLLI